MSNSKAVEWLMKAGKAPNGVSPLGRVVADVVDKTWGIHNAPFTKSPVDWANDYVIVLILSWRTIATVDDSDLTRLVILSHDNALRMQIGARAQNCLELMFHQRERNSQKWSKHCPTIEEQIERVRRTTDGAGVE